MVNSYFHFIFDMNSLPVKKITALLLWLSRYSLVKDNRTDCEAIVFTLWLQNPESDNFEYISEK